MTWTVVLLDAADTLFENVELDKRIRNLHLDGGPAVTEEVVRHGISVVGDRAEWPEDSATTHERLRKWATFYASAFTELGHQPDLARRRGTYLAEAVVEPSGYRLFDDALPALTALQERGVILGVVSNFDPLLGLILDHLQIRELFDVVVSSWDVGCYKPDPRIFQAALEPLDVRAESACFVGDSLYSDIGGARSAGLHPILIDRTGDHRDVDVDRIESLEEIASRYP